jgi:hypothetical protein
MSLFTLATRRVPQAQSRAGEIARGDFWSVLREGDDHILCYLSAGLHGREERLHLSEDEARGIVDGRVAVEHFLPR